jgi:hypothetical protein
MDALPSTGAPYHLGAAGVQHGLFAAVFRKERDDFDRYAIHQDSFPQASSLMGECAQFAVRDASAVLPDSKSCRLKAENIVTRFTAERCRHSRRPTRRTVLNKISDLDFAERPLPFFLPRSCRQIACDRSGRHRP